MQILDDKAVLMQTKKIVRAEREYIGELSDIFVDLSPEELLEIIQKYQQIYAGKNIVFDSYEDSLYIYEVREETDEEFQERISLDLQKAKFLEAYELKELKRLQAKYQGDLR